MFDEERGVDRSGRRSKRFLTPLGKYEIWLQLIRQEMTIGEAADRYQVDRSTIRACEQTSHLRRRGLSVRVQPGQHERDGGCVDERLGRGHGGFVVVADPAGSRSARTAARARLGADLAPLIRPARP